MWLTVFAAVILCLTLGAACGRFTNLSLAIVAVVVGLIPALVIVLAIAGEINFYISIETFVTIATYGLATLAVFGVVTAFGASFGRLMRCRVERNI